MYWNRSFTSPGASMFSYSFALNSFSSTSFLPGSFSSSDTLPLLSHEHQRADENFLLQREALVEIVAEHLGPAVDLVQHGQNLPDADRRGRRPARYEQRSPDVPRGGRHLGREQRQCGIGETADRIGGFQAGLEDRHNLGLGVGKELDQVRLQLTAGVQPRQQSIGEVERIGNTDEDEARGGSRGPLEDRVEDGLLAAGQLVDLVQHEHHGFVLSLEHPLGCVVQVGKVDRHRVVDLQQCVRAGLDLVFQIRDRFLVLARGRQLIFQLNK
uniref:Uncharacterized protein n=1 Tax=Anopheles atroparvus TaxID=41427 RepID=A0A182JE93_ANOAO